MNVKIDTKEKFTVLTPISPLLNDNLAAEIVALSQNCLQSSTKNVIVNFENIKALEVNAAVTLVALQNKFYENSASFVFCHFNKDVEAGFEQAELLEIINYTPTESEAWDIVQMEEIERELLDDEHPLFPEHQEDF
ncbi:MAG: STAS domain-containing protein [Chitinophagaceae bacterium]